MKNEWQIFPLSDHLWSMLFQPERRSVCMSRCPFVCISVLKQFNMYNANADSVDTSFECVAVRFNCIFNQPHRIHTERQCMSKQHRGHWKSNHFRS